MTKSCSKSDAFLCVFVFRFDTTLPGMAYYPQFLQISALLHNNYVYGFGEHRHESFRHDMNYRKWSIFTRDAGPDVSFVELCIKFVFNLICILLNKSKLTKLDTDYSSNPSIYSGCCNTVYFRSKCYVMHIHWCGQLSHQGRPVRAKKKESIGQWPIKCTMIDL